MERYYFYIDQSGVQHGPLSLKHLIAEGISLSTVVWYEGLPDWQSADQIYELRQELSIANSRINMPPTTPSDFAPLYNAVNPPVYQQQRVVVVERPKKWIIEAILVTIFCCLPSGIVALVYALRAEDKWSANLYDESLKASNNAGLWVKISVFAVLMIPILYFLGFFGLFGIASIL